MHAMFHARIRIALYGIMLLGIISSALGFSGATVARAREAGNAPPASGSVPIQGQEHSQSGWFSIIWGDASEGKARTLYTLTDERGQTTILQLDETLARSLGGVLSLNHKWISVSGILSAVPSGQGATPILNVTSIDLAPASGTKVPGGDYSPAVIGSRPWVSILCKFSDQAVEPKNLAFFQGMYASTRPGLDHYWRELSYDLANVIGSSANGWYVLPHPEAYYNPTDTAGGTNLSTLANDCIAAADPVVNYSLYSGINMMFNTDFDNGWAWGGSRYMTLDGVTRYWSTTWEPPWAYADISVIAHEMGHGFGLPHSSGNYGQVYDNAWDVMSEDRFNCAADTDPVYGCIAQHTISWHKDILGWIPAGQVFTAGDNINTTITLERLALPQTGNYKMAKIPIVLSSTHFYTLEARQLTGYDVKLAGAAVIIHEVDTTRGIPAHVIDIDGNGNTGDAGAMWTVGETFSDPSAGIAVHIDAATATGFQVTITTTPIRLISGYVRNAAGAGLRGVTMNGLPRAPLTDANGFYSDLVVNGWSGTVTPEMLNYTYAPVSLSYSNITSDQPDQNYTGTYHPSGNPILLVDDDNNNPDVRAYYTDALTALGKSYDVWDTKISDNEPDAAALAYYQMVIWFTGVGYGVSTGPGADGESALSAWLNASGCFLLSSQDYYYARGLTPFASTYLGASAVTSDVSQTTVTGLGSVFNGLGPYTLSYPFDNYSDLILPDTTAENAFGGDKGNAAVDKNGGSYRSAYLGFPVEAIALPADRQQVLGTFLNWCTATVVVPPIPHGVQATFGTYPDKVQVSWAASVGATYYEVYRNSSDSTTGVTLLGSPTATLFNDTTAATGSIYWYFVKACNSAGCSGFSLSDSGYRGLNGTTYLPLVLSNSASMCSVAPTLNYPANGSSLDNLIPLYQWDNGQDPNATAARLQVASDPGFTQIATEWWIGSAHGPYQLRDYWNLDPGTVYYWRTFLMCGETVHGPYSATWTFTTGSGGVILPAPNLLAPPNGAVLPGTSTTLQWTAVNGAVEYFAFWWIPNGGGYLSRTTSTSLVPWYLAPNSTFQWTAAARNDYAWGNDSVTWTFTTGAGAPPGGGTLLPSSAPDHATYYVNPDGQVIIVTGK
jgi:M6 family metalloprotease-like protein